MKRSKQKKRRGNCYVCVESLYHLLGGKDSGWTPHVMKHEGDTHWFLAKRVRPPGADGAGLEHPAVIMPIKVILDPTVAQFKRKPDYSKARPCGFLTKDPSKRAQVLMEQMLWQVI